MGLGSALSEEEGAVSSPPFFIVRTQVNGMVLKAKTFIALDALGEPVILTLAVLILCQYITQ